MRHAHRFSCRALLYIRNGDAGKGYVVPAPEALVSLFFGFVKGTRHRKWQELWWFPFPKKRRSQIPQHVRGKIGTKFGATFGTFRNLSDLRECASNNPDVTTLKQQRNFHRAMHNSPWENCCFMDFDYIACCIKNQIPNNSWGLRIHIPRQFVYVIELLAWSFFL